MTDGWTVKESNPAAPEFAQSDSLILRLSRLSRRAFSVFGVGARLSQREHAIFVADLMPCS